MLYSQHALGWPSHVTGDTPVWISVSCNGSLVEHVDTDWFTLSVWDSKFEMHTTYSCGCIYDAKYWSKACSVNLVMQLTKSTCIQEEI